MSDFQATLVFNVDGQIDVDATLARFTKEVTLLKQSQEAERVEIARAVHAVFDEHPGASCNMDYVLFGAMRRLNIDVSLHKEMKAKIHNYVRANADRWAEKDKDGNVVAEAEPPRTRMFSISRGRGATSGVRRWSDVPVDKK